MGVVILMTGLRDPMQSMAPVPWRSGPPARRPEGELNLQERAIVRRLKAGETRAQAAEALQYAPDTVKRYVRQAKQRLGVTEDAELFQFL